MINHEEIKKFVELFLKQFDIQYTIDKNNIYNVKLEEILANKLGKEIRFTFNKQISNDYGVSYIHPKSKILLSFINYSLKFGIESYGKLNKKRALKNIYLEKYSSKIQIINTELAFNKAIVFLFKISSSNKISDSDPEKLKYYFYDLNSKEIIKSLSDEFHNLIIEDNKFKIEKEKVLEVYRVVLEYIDNDLGKIYDEYENINNKTYEKRKEELENRHLEYKKGLQINETKIESQIEDLNNRILGSRTITREEEYRQLLNKKKDELQRLRLNSTDLIKKHYERITKDITEESKKYEFEVNINLQSVICLEYPVELLTIKTLENEKIVLTSNLILDNSIQFICPSCNFVAKDLRISFSDYFCCENCSKSFENSYVCPRDKTVQCSMTGEILKPNTKNLCEYCNNHYKKEFLTKSYENKNICSLCSYDCQISGLKAPKNHLINISSKDLLVLPNYTAKCDFTKDNYLKDDLKETTGDKKLISIENIKKCKKLNLTYSPENMDGEYSKLFKNLKDLEISEIRTEDLKKLIPNKIKKCKYSEDKYKILICYTKLFMDNYIIYDKKTKEINKL